MERCGDEFVTIPPRPSRAAREFAGEQRFEPRLARPQPAHGRDPVKRAGKLDGGDDENVLPNRIHRIISGQLPALWENYRQGDQSKGDAPAFSERIWRDYAV